MTARAWPVAALLLAACHGESVNGTLLVVEVDSDLAVPAQLDTLDISVHTASGGNASHQFSVAAGGLPVRLAVVPEGKTSGDLTITVTASAHGMPTLSQLVATAFVPNEARTLAVFLGSNCLGVAPGCGTGKTCRAGACMDPGAGVVLAPYPGDGGVILDAATMEAAAPQADGGADASLAPDAGDASTLAPDAGADLAPDGPVVCTAPSTMCGPACVNLQNDPKNCGACNRACPGACTMGVCAPVMIAGGQDNPGDLLVDDTFLYWRRGAPHTGSIARARKDGTGGVADLVTAIDGQGAMASDGSRLYYFGNANIFSCAVPTCGMPQRMAPTMPTMSLGISIIDVQLNPAKARVFWTDHQKIFSVPAIGGPSQTHLTGDFPSTSLAVDLQWIYYVDRDAMGVIGLRKRTANDPPAIDMLINFPAGAGFPRQVALTADRLLWVSNGVVGSTVLNPPTTTPPAPLASGSPTRMAVEGNTVFWADYTSATAGRILSCSTTGCRGVPPRVIAATCGAGDVAADSAYVYWSCAGTGVVMKAAR